MEAAQVAAPWAIEAQHDPRQKTLNRSREPSRPRVRWTLLHCTLLAGRRRDRGRTMRSEASSSHGGGNSVPEHVACLEIMVSDSGRTAGR